MVALTQVGSFRVQNIKLFKKIPSYSRSWRSPLEVFIVS